MKNKFTEYFLVLFLLFFAQKIFADEISINATEVEIDKSTKIVYAKGSVEIDDGRDNKIFSENAEYNKSTGIVKTIGQTKIITSEKYHIDGENLIYDDNKKIIYSEYFTVITDKNKNKISVDMFNYLTLKKMFFSKGEIELIDNKSNKNLFSEIYIDEQKNKIVGSDIKSYFNQSSFKLDKEMNQGSMLIAHRSVKVIQFLKGVFTSCKKREGKSVLLGQ